MCIVIDLIWLNQILSSILIRIVVYVFDLLFCELRESLLFTAQTFVIIILIFCQLCIHNKAIQKNNKLPRMRIREQDHQPQRIRD
ncbi:hypothetical protein VNO78_21243 [Psophocarpus tetragonolobus]|uniref:Uncharacterized protein n=1 Tax=Psophocarpus tetragonolobus TaxID=3891 RepID=A0AAN9SCX8_PSOTE